MKPLSHYDSMTSELSPHLPSQIHPENFPPMPFPSSPSSTLPSFARLVFLPYHQATITILPFHIQNLQPPLFAPFHLLFPQTPHRAFYFMNSIFLPHHQALHINLPSSHQHTCSLLPGFCSSIKMLARSSSMKS